MTVLRVGSHTQTVPGLKCCAHPRLYPLTRYQVEAEALENHCQYRLEFHHGKRRTDTATWSSPKGDECIRSMGLASGGIKALGSEQVPLAALLMHTMPDRDLGHDD